MESDQLKRAFERDGHVALRGAFDVAASARMSEAIWQYIEHHTEVRRDDRTTWPTAWFPISFKRLKRNPAFTAALDNPTTRTTLDQIFGASSWHASKSGAQILVTFPNATKESWRVPSDLWHMDTSFGPVAPLRSVKLFSVVEALPPRGGATMVITGTHSLQAEYARQIAPHHQSGQRGNWHRFLKHTDPWLAGLTNDRGEVDRNSNYLTEPHTISDRPVQIRELCGAPGDTHLTHINLFHSVSANANDRPRIVVTHHVQTGVR